MTKQIIPPGSNGVIISLDEYRRRRSSGTVPSDDPLAEFEAHDAELGRSLERLWPAADEDTAAFDRLAALSARVWSMIPSESRHKNDRGTDDTLTRCENLARSLLEDIRFLAAQRSEA